MARPRWARRIKPDGLAVLRNGEGKLFPARIQVAEHLVGLGELGGQRDGAFHVGLCGVEVAPRGQGGRVTIVGRCQVWLVQDGRAEGCLGLRRVAGGHEGVPQQFLNARVGGLNQGRGTERGDRIRQAALLLIGTG